VDLLFAPLQILSAGVGSVGEPCSRLPCYNRNEPNFRSSEYTLSTFGNQTILKETLAFFESVAKKKRADYLINPEFLLTRAKS
jgi:hypothetical protein